MITAQTRIADIQADPVMGRLVPTFVVSPKVPRFTPEQRICEIKKPDSPWGTDELLYGLHRMEALTARGVQMLYSVYPEEECREDPTKAGVTMLYFPADTPDPDGRFIILCSGGAYMRVCNLWEAFPVAARFNELGYTVFCVNYRTDIMGLFPRPMDDLAAAYRLIAANAEAFGVDPANYAVGGFSAGGHLSAAWGMEDIGARHYGLPMPKLLILVYAFMRLRWTAEMMKGGDDIVTRIMLGEHYTQEDILRYDVESHVDAAYPPCYLVQAADDEQVHISNSDRMAELLAEKGIPYRYDRAPSGRHGFGLGESIAAKGWVEKCAAFMKTIE